MKVNTVKLSKKESNLIKKYDHDFDVINREVQSLLLNRYIIEEIQKIIKNNRKIQKPSIFYNYLRYTYAQTIALGIRKLTELNKDSISFVKLLNKAAKSPKLYSRERFVSAYQEGHKNIANKDFNNFSSDCNEYIDPNLIEKDVSKMRELAKECKVYVDKHIAHIDEKPMEDLPHFSNFNKCMDFLEEMLKKYWLLFRCKTLFSALPAIQYDWKQIFKEPWINKQRI